VISVDDNFGLPHMDDRDMACVILPDLDYEAQLVAIADLLRRHKKDDEQTAAQIKEVEEFARRSTGLRNEHAVDDWIDLLHGSTYQEAAHSMAAIGMIAPLIESLFYQAFQGIRAVYYGVDLIPLGSPRSAIGHADKFWDCHQIYDPKHKKCKKDLVLGIIDLAGAVGLKPHIPEELLSMLPALYRYRNKMFHFGFEWPARECRSFAKEIAKEGWQQWFSSATRDDVPFIFYMTEAFVSASLASVYELLNGFGAYCASKTPTGSIQTCAKADYHVLRTRPRSENGFCASDAQGQRCLRLEVLRYAVG